MSDQGKANYEGFHAAIPGAKPVPWDDLPYTEKLCWDGGAYLVEAWVSEQPADEDDEPFDTPAPGLTPVEAVRLAVAEEWQPRVDALRARLDEVHHILARQPEQRRRPPRRHPRHPGQLMSETDHEAVQELTPGQAARAALHRARWPHAELPPWDNALLGDEGRAAWDAAGNAAVAVAVITINGGLVREGDRLREQLAEARAVAAEMLGEFRPGSSGHTARVGQVQIAKWRERAGIEAGQ